MKAWQFLLVFTVALALRLALYHGADRPVSDATIAVDSRDYVQLGSVLSKHGVFSRSANEPFARAADRTPLYPCLIAVVFQVTPDEVTAIKTVLCVQHLLGALTACLCAWALFLVLKDVRWALAGGFLVGLEPSAIRYGMMAWTETFFVFLLIVSIALLLVYFTSNPPRIGLLVIAGACFALTALCRPVGQEIAMVAVPIALLLDARLPWKARIHRALLPFVVAYVVIVMPWVIRNYTSLGVINISTGAADAKFLAAARVQAAADAFPQRPTPRDMAVVHRKLFITYLTEFYEANPWERSGATTLEEDVERSMGWAWPDVVPDQLTGRWMSFLAHKSSAVIRQHFRLYVKYSVEMGFNMVFGFNKDTLSTILKVPPSEGQMSSILKSCAKGNFKSAAGQLSTVTWAEWLGLAWSALYSVLVPFLALAGLFAMLKKKVLSETALLLVTLALLVLLAAFGVSMNYQSSRYAVPAKPFLIVFAVAGMQFLFTQFGPFMRLVNGRVGIRSKTSTGMASTSQVIFGSKNDEDRRHK